MFRNYSGIFSTLCSPGILKALVYSKSENETNSEPCQASTMESLAKIINSCSCFRKSKLFLQYQLFTFSTFFNKSLFFTPEVFILYKKVWWPIEPGAVNLDTFTLCCNLFYNGFIKFI